MKTELKERIENQIKSAIECNENLDERDWGSQYGVLISVNDAIETLKAILPHRITEVSDEDILMKAQRFLQSKSDLGRGGAYLEGYKEAMRSQMTAKSDAIDFADWLMTECELYKDQTLWQYEGGDYSLEGIYSLFLKQKDTK